MKITIISGSTRVGRNSHRVTVLLQNYIQEALNIKTDIIDLAVVDIPMFKERYVDMTEPELLYVNISEQLKSSDGVIFVTPEYNGSITSALKNLIDIYGSREFGKKPISIATVSSGRLGGIRAGMQLQQIVLSINGHLFPRMLLTGEVTKMIDEQGNIIQDNYKIDLENFCTNFVNYILEIQDANYCKTK